MRNYLLSALLIIMLSACAPSTNTVGTAIAQTQAAQPTSTPAPTATPISFSALNLETILIVNGDLPAGYEASQIRAELSDISKKSPKPDYFISQSLSHNGSLGGIVEVLVYEDIEKAKSAFQIIIANLPGDPASTNIGDLGQVASTSIIVNTVSLTFIRCHAVVAIQLMGTDQKNDVSSYAKRLDARLQPLVCRS